MIRNLKALGLAVVAVVAMSAIAASAAQASHFGWGAGTNTLEIVADPTEPNQVITTTPSTLTCNEATGSIKVTGSTAETLETEGLKFDNNKTGKCVGTGGLEPKIEMNGCNYLLHADATVDPTDGKKGIEVTKNIVCPKESKGIVINAGFLCTITIPPQTGLGGVTATNVQTSSKEEVTLESTIEKVKYSHTGLCGTGSAESGIVHTKWTMKGRINPPGTQTDVTVT